MSYPPQQPGPYGPQGPYGPGGQQPGGYGQQPRPGQYGPAGDHFGQQPPAPGGYSTAPGGYGPPGGYGSPGGYGTAPGGFGPPPGGPGGFGNVPGGPPPRRGKTGLWLGVGGGAVVVVAALLITGLVAPGWMLGGNSPRDVAQAVADAFNTRNFQELRDVACGGTDNDDIDTLQQQVQKLNITVNVTLTGDPRVDGDTATQRADVAVHGGPKDGNRTVFVVTMEKQDGAWCARGLQAEPGSATSGGAGVEPGSSSGSDAGSDSSSRSGASMSGTVQSVAQAFLDRVNAGDVAAAQSMMCADAPARDTVTRIVDKGLQLKIKPGQDLSGRSFQIVNIVPARGHGGGFVSVFEADGGDGLCVHSFMAYSY